MTPAQASGHPNFVTDWPTQGPTDPGLRAADCNYSRNFLPPSAPCADCKGPIPMWANHAKLGLSGPISFGSRPALGFAVGSPGDPDVFSSLTSDQQKWVIDTLIRLNDLIVKSTGTTCPTFGPSVPAAAGCFQVWFNSTIVGQPVRPLRTDGVFDQDTLNSLITTTQIHAKDFPQLFPSSGTAKEKKLSTAAMVGVAAAGTAVIGGIIYAVSSGGKPKRRR